MSTQLQQLQSDFMGNHISVSMPVPPAAGDGVADDTAAISDTVLAISAVGGGVLLFPEGTYSIKPPGKTSITGATNATPIVIAATTSFATGQSVIVYGVGGNTAANGTWIVTNVDATHFSLNGSAGNGAYTSGGTANQSYILEMASNIEIRGEGMGISVIKVANSAGSYNSIFGPRFSAFSHVAFRNISVNQNGTGNPQISTSDALAHSRFLISTTSAATDLVLDHFEATDINCINLVQSGSTPTSVTNCRFTAIGSGSVYHDHSTLYIQCEGITCTDNLFVSSGVNSAGAVTAIETHGGMCVVTGNLIDGMMIGMNITGVRSNSANTPQTANVVVQNNIVLNGYYGIFLWSQIPVWSSSVTYITGDIVLETGISYVATSGSTNSAPHLLSHWAVTAWTGLQNVVVSGNSLTLTQTAWTTNAGGGTGMIGNPVGIELYIASNVPIKDVRITNNVCEFDLEPNNTFPWDSSGFGLGYWDSTNLNTVDGLTVSGNVVRNHPGPGIRFASAGQNIRIEENQLINCGSTLAAATTSFECGIFLASLTPIPNLRIRGNSIVDNNATTRMIYGIEFATSNVGDIECTGNTVAVTGATTTAFLGGWNIAVAGQIPLIQDIIYAPNSSNNLPIGGLVALDSTIRDLNSHQSYRVRANGNTWNRTVVTSSAPPASGAWVIGDFAWNDSPSGLQPIVGWTCIANGTPGTWVPLTALDMTGSITLANAKSYQFKNAAGSGTLIGILANASDDLEIGAGGTAHKTVIKTSFMVSANDKAAAAGEISFGNVTGLGNGAAVAIGTVQLGTGTGPATPGSVASWLRINIGGTTAWIPWFL